MLLKLLHLALAAAFLLGAAATFPMMILAGFMFDAPGSERLLFTWLMAAFFLLQPFVLLMLAFLTLIYTIGRATRRAFWFVYACGAAFIMLNARLYLAARS